MAHSKIPGYADLWVNSLMIGDTGFIITEDELGTITVAGRMMGDD